MGFCECFLALHTLIVREDCGRRTERIIIVHSHSTTLTHRLRSCDVVEEGNDALLGWVGMLRKEGRLPSS